MRMQELSTRARKITIECPISARGENENNEKPRPWMCNLSPRLRFSHRRDAALCARAQSDLNFLPQAVMLRVSKPRKLCVRYAHISPRWPQPPRRPIDGRGGRICAYARRSKDSSAQGSPKRAYRDRTNRRQGQEKTLRQTGERAPWPRPRSKQPDDRIRLTEHARVRFGRRMRFASMMRARASARDRTSLFDIVKRSEQASGVEPFRRRWPFVHFFAGMVRGLSQCVRRGLP